ncbi:MAG: hypothetical protein ABWZ64_05635 [Xanthobacteraceae bacterium]
MRRHATTSGYGDEIERRLGFEYVFFRIGDGVFGFASLRGLAGNRFVVARPLLHGELGASRAQSRARIRFIQPNEKLACEYLVVCTDKDIGHPSDYRAH